ncbi:UNVERIFIED_CONTAM: hypothetical protein RMT77_000024 [Armadillidium vulgare]
MNQIMLKIRTYQTSPVGQIILGILQFLPYFLIIITLKTILIFMFLNSYSYDNQTNSAQFSDYGINVQDSKGELSKNPEDRAKLLARALTPSNANRTPENTMWLFFNRIPRTGGQTIVSLLKSLSIDRDLQHQEHEYMTPWQRLMRHDEQKNLATWFEYNTWPISYDRFAMYIDFEFFMSDYAPSKPAYFTMVRDPVEKFISYYHSKRIDSERSKFEMSLRERQKSGLGRKWYWRTVDECVLEKDDECDFREGKLDFLSAISFLCGQEEECLQFGNKGALQMAKFHAEYDYSVVGLLEDLNTTLIVLEDYLPLFFSGAFQRYWDKDFKTKKENKNPKSYEEPSEKVIKILRDKFALELELYEFLRQRLAKQFSQIDKEMIMKRPLIKKAAIKSLGPLDRFQIELRHLEKNRNDFQRLNGKKENRDDAIEVEHQDPDEMPVLDAQGNIPGYNVLINE